MCIVIPCAMCALSVSLSVSPSLLLSLSHSLPLSPPISLSLSPHLCVCVCVRACVHACVRAGVRARVCCVVLCCVVLCCVCVCGHGCKGVRHLLHYYRSNDTCPQQLTVPPSLPFSTTEVTPHSARSNHSGTKRI